MHRAYTQLTVKAVDEDQRIITGIATSAATDRTGDIVEPDGAEFKLPLPLLWQHDSKQPIGEVFAAKVTKAGIEIKARIARMDEPGKLKDRLDEAWQSLKLGLVRGLSIGFKSLEDADIKGTFGIRFIKWLWLELSAVTIPANSDASILSIKQHDLGVPESGTTADRPRSSTAGVTAPTPRTRRVSAMKKVTPSDRVTQCKTDRKGIAERMEALMKPVLEDDAELTDEQQKEYDDLMADLKAVDADIVRFEALERASVMPKAVKVEGDSTEDAITSRGRRYQHIDVKSTLPPGIEFTRYVICKAAARIFGVSPLEVAKERYPDNPRIQMVLKAAVAGATTTDATWAAPLLQDITTLTGEFLEYLRPKTIIGRLPLTRVPFYSRVQSQTSGGSANWVGQAVQKPVTKFDYDALTLTSAKVAAIAVLSDELVRFSSPSAEGRVRDSLVGIITERLDRDFIDPDKAVSANVSPASITNGITGLTPSSGGDAADVRTDVAALMGAFIGSNQDVSGLHWIMSGTSALQLMLMRNALGNREFPDITVNGGTFEGFPVITSQYCAVVGSPTPNVVILLNPKEIFLADDGGVTVDMSNEASIEMSDDPANESGTVVSMYQTNQVALRAERFINWARGRTSAVAWLDAAAWSAAA